MNPNPYLDTLLLFLTTLWVIGCACCLLATPEPESRADRLADPAPMPGELPAAGYLGYTDRSQWVYRARPVPDTAPQPSLGEYVAAPAEETEREIRVLGDQAEAIIPARWR